MQESKTELRTASTIFLLSIILFAETGYFVLYSFQQYQIKHDVKKQLALVKPNLLEVIELEKNAAAIAWEEKDKEFLLKGDMYDVKRIEKQNGKTLLYCINDSKENELVKKMVDAVRKNQRDKKNNSFQFQLTDCIITNTSLLSFSTLTLKEDFFHFNESAIYLPVEITVPPPRFA